MSDQFTVDEEAHVYTLNGRVLPTVTQILTSAGIIDYQWLKNDREFYLTRGSYVHKATELYDLDDLDYDALDPVIKPYVDGYIKFKRDTGFKPQLIEHRSFNASLGYAGTLDRVGELNGRRVMIDFKSGPVAKWVELQNAAYLNMKDVWTVSATYGLQLKDDGTYNLTEGWTDFTGAFRVFQAALQVHRWKNK